MSSALLDRDDEVAALGAELQAVYAGAGRVVVVEGPAGIGKSSLLAAVARSAAASRATVLRARGGPLDHDAPWGVARQLFAPVRAGSAWTELAVGTAALAARALDPAAPRPAVAGDAMHSAALGLTWLAGNLAEQSPTLLLVDDLHWADTPSLRWLAQLSRRLEDMPLAVVCALRSGEPAHDEELLAEILSAAPRPPVRPRPLGPSAAETLVRERLPAADGAFAHACHAVTAGNPFLLHALLTQLEVDQVTPSERTSARLSAYGPEQVARTVERQLARLPDGAAELARALAVLGREVPPRQAARVAGLEPAAASRAADALRAAGLAEGELELALTHPLVEGALHTGMAPGERARAHARAAHILEQDGAGAERVALHLLHSEPAADAATVATLRTAASRAGLRGAPQSAAALLRRALAEPPAGAAEEADVRAELGLALTANVSPDAPVLLREAVALAPEPARRAEIALRGARALSLDGHVPEAIELARAGLADAADTPPQTVARLEAELVAVAWADADTVSEARARVAAPLVDPPPPLWRVNAAMSATFDAEPAADVLELLAPALVALDQEPDSLLVAIALFVLTANERLDSAIEICTRMIDAARPRGWLIALALGSHMRAMALVRAGRIHDAASDAQFAFDFKLRATPVVVMLFALHAHLDALTELDETAEADAALAAAGQLGDPPPGALAGALALQSRGHLRLAQRRFADAHADLTATAARWRELQVRHPGLAGWRPGAAEALVALGDPGEAHRLAEEHVGLAQRAGLAGAHGAGLRALARTAPVAERIAMLEQAAQLTAGAPLEHVRVLVDLGAALRRANRRADARRPLRRALELADRGGMRLLARRARAELHAAGARPRRSALSGPAALTPAEHQVAALAARGSSNREIAEQLYVTVRTVETHLTHVFQKLGVAGRAELAPALGATSADPQPPPSRGRFHGDLPATTEVMTML
jgi:DNA-binding NarL/FixJ family response regulator